MCGIAGYINLTHAQFTVDESLLELMQQKMVHRGPDGYRMYVNQAHGIGLVHRRLSIIDLSDAGLQPMVSADGSIVVCFNGEIYNHSAVRNELEQFGYQFTTTSDTQVLLYAFAQWGIACLDKLHGMFACALFNARSGELYLVRDRLGIKPLYFSVQGGMLSFASEIKALTVLPWMSKELNPSAAYHYLSYLAAPAPLTFYQGIYKLPAGYYVRIDAQRALSFKQWYTTSSSLLATASYSFDEAVETVRTLLSNAVASHAQADVPIGVFLSGGIDSSALTALLVQRGITPTTYSVAFEHDDQRNELAWARAVARKYKTNHHELMLTESAAFDAFKKLLYFQDEPLGDCVCVPLYAISHAMRATGTTVVLVGEGSDELFCGYPSYARNLRMAPLWKWSQKLVPQPARHALFKAATRIKTFHPNRAALAYNWSQDRFFFSSGAWVFSDQWKHSFITVADQAHDPIVEQLNPSGNILDSYEALDFHRRSLRTNASPLQQMLYLELIHRLPELLLMRADKMTMAASLECRVPFLDHTLVEYALSLPDHYKYGNRTTKYVLKAAVRGLIPDEIIDRKKVGFGAPTSLWFKTDSLFKKHMHELLDDPHNPWRDYLNFGAIKQLLLANQDPKVDYSYQLWALFNLLAWRWQ